jgi:Glyoxalase-like domain
LRIFREGNSLSDSSGLELDHAFIGCAAGAPEGEALLHLGFVEGSSNVHPGQGTANRRFFFDNFMLELVWVADPSEAQNERTRRTRLWDRLERQNPDVSPFGIIFKASAGGARQAPFPTWSYTPAYLPPGVAMQVADGTSLYEPEIFYLPFVNRGRRPSNEPTLHAVPIRKITALSIGVCRLAQLSNAGRIAQQLGLLSYFESPQPVMQIAFEGPAGSSFDLRPRLPLIFRSAATPVS